ncbi:MAG: helix-turn-helix domain-containing protein [Candidatus Methylacidiphilales bacterium]|nr:AraC family transcriptional regulator [Candidatus Methylacidiphilales bacterium]
MLGTGATPLRSGERFLQLVQVQLHVSRRMKIVPSVWNYKLLSPFWRIYSVESTGAYVQHGERKTHLVPGRLCMIPAWLPFQTGLTKAVVQDFMHFNVTGLPPTLIRRVFDRPIMLPADVVLDELATRWKAGFDVAPDAFHVGQPEVESVKQLHDFGWALALIHAVLATSLTYMPAARRALCARWLEESRELQPVLDHIDARLKNPPSNEELARLYHVSPSHLIRLFRKKMGLTPAQYGLERRVAVAAAWLTSTDLTLEHIAEQVGFTDRFHFSKAFKACLGVPPVKYRLMHRKDV